MERNRNHGSVTSWTRRSQQGYAMVIVMVFITTSMMLLSAAYDRMHQLFVFEESSDRLRSDADDMEAAIGAGLAKLQSGEPEVDHNGKYKCEIVLKRANGSAVEYELAYEKLGGNEWSLEAEEKSGGSPCPASFNDSACPSP